jgi:predicted dehydrogenase
VKENVRLAVAGLGRMGSVHAFHAKELTREMTGCDLVALADSDPQKAKQVQAELGGDIALYDSVEALASAGICDATVIVTPTDQHREHTSLMIRCGSRVLLEKPLTGTLEEDRQFSAELRANSPDALMLAFQRRFDEPLRYAKQLIDEGAIGKVFKIYSALEDSNPAPNGYRSGGILPDMAIHNVDEVLWLSGRMPLQALSIGSRIYSHALTTCVEDFDDALLYLWFDTDLVAQIQVGRNHVSGYRVETVVFGDQGQIQIGHFEQTPFEITVSAYGRRGSRNPLTEKKFQMRDYQRQLPEFVDRFGAAYKAELATFIECCRDNKPFPVTQEDGVRAQEVISAGMRALFGSEDAARLNTD